LEPDGKRDKMDEKITLDRGSFKALSVDTRVNILKQLDERRKTLSELSKGLALRNSTVKEHMEILLGAGLVKKIDEGYKWKYYSLTMKGKNIVNPTEIKVLITLALSSMMLFGAMFVFLSRIYSLQFTPAQFASGARAPTLEAADSVSKVVADIPAMGAAEGAPLATPLPTPFQAAQFIPFPELSLVVLLALVVGACAGYLLRKRI